MALCLLISCEYNEVNYVFPGPTYKGKLIIMSLADYPTFDVTLTFSGDRFSFSSHPSLCEANCNNGTYQISGDEIEFTSDCTHPLQCFEGLDGKYQLKILGRHVEMTKNLTSIGYRFTYNLVLQ